jgi:thioredoxin-related protein
LIQSKADAPKHAKINMYRTYSYKIELARCFSHQEFESSSYEGRLAMTAHITNFITRQAARAALHDAAAHGRAMIGISVLLIAALIWLAAGSNPAGAETSIKLPPAIGPEQPMVEPEKGGDGLYHQTWFNQSFLNLREDFEDAKHEGKRFAVIFEQLGCIYCIKMHKEVLAKKYINDYVRENYRIVQLNLWGDREVTDFDGTVLTEKELVRRWSVVFTPWIVFFKDDLTGLDGKWGPELEVMRMGLGIGPGTFYDMFSWIRIKGYQGDEHFQRFHIRRINERAAITKKQASNKSGKMN